jgi:DNA repair photolyase
VILNISGRTDIVAFYSDWLINRLDAGFIDVRNPFYPKMVSRIMMDDVDLLFFCTKNPAPILDKLKDIKKKIYFHVTLTSYKKDIEPHVPPKGKVIESIKKLSNIIGKENLVIRYDPIFISEEYSLDYHVKAFNKLCELLDGYVCKILIHFIDDYKNVRNNMASLRYHDFNEEDYEKIGLNFSRIAEEHGLYVHTCFEDRDLVEYGFVKDDCLSKELAYKLTGKKYGKWKARKGGKCNCVEMVDIGVYNTCSHFCKYCYANYDEKKVSIRHFKQDENENANEQYAQIEKNIDKAKAAVVLVAVSDVKELREAYPSYFLNAGEFISELSDFQRNCQLKGYIK